jgi:hypothetical protein
MSARRSVPYFVPSPFVAALLALCLALAGVAPSVSRVLLAGGPHDVCTADGTSRTVPPAGHGAGHEAACALCGAHGGSHAAPPPVARPAAARLAAVDPGPDRVATSFVGGPVRFTPPQRAPPPVRA